MVRVRVRVRVRVSGQGQGYAPESSEDPAMLTATHLVTE